MIWHSQQSPLLLLTPFSKTFSLTKKNLKIKTETAALKSMSTEANIFNVSDVYWTVHSCES